MQPRKLAEAQVWTLEDVAALKEFTEVHFRHRMSVGDWSLAGKFMNIHHSNCIAKMWELNRFHMTPQLYSQITEFRQAGLLWPTICEQPAVGACSPDILRFVYTTTPKDKVKKPRREKPKFSISRHQHWNADEDRKLLGLLDQFGDGRDIDWNFISKSIGHSKNACRYRRIRLMRDRQDREGSQTISDTSADGTLVSPSPE
ncbi:hypothetical protein GGF46_000499 [Coemansia sp. RSA 552]|nr:hypothetical protein GGF46_000499 [Coemansia sp. RSA 552]